MFVCELCDRHPIQHETELTPSMSLSPPWPLLGPTVSRIPTLSNQPSQCAQAIRDKTWLWYFVCTVISVLKTNDICLISVVFYVPTPLYIYICVCVCHTVPPLLITFGVTHCLASMCVCVCLLPARPASQHQSWILNASRIAVRWLQTIYLYSYLHILYHCWTARCSYVSFACCHSNISCCKTVLCCCRSVVIYTQIIAKIFSIKFKVLVLVDHREREGER